MVEAGMLKKQGVTNRAGRMEKAVARLLRLLGNAGCLADRGRREYASRHA